MSLDLSAALEAALADDAVFRATTIGDVVRTSVAAAAPLIEAAVREQIAVEIEALDNDPLIKGLVSINPSAQAAIEWAAARARGESA